MDEYIRLNGRIHASAGDEARGTQISQVGDVVEKKRLAPRGDVQQPNPVYDTAA